MTTQEELTQELTGSIIDDGLYVAAVSRQHAEEITALVWPFLAKAWAEGYAIGAAEWPDDNPYTVQSETDSTVPKTD